MGVLHLYVVVSCIFSGTMHRICCTQLRNLVHGPSAKLMPLLLHRQLPQDMLRLQVHQRLHPHFGVVTGQPHLDGAAATAKAGEPANGANKRRA
jgi:hypothetical protein